MHESEFVDSYADPRTESTANISALVGLLDSNVREGLLDLLTTPEGRSVAGKLLDMLNLSPAYRDLADSWMDVAARTQGEQRKGPGYLIESSTVATDDLEQELADLRNVNDNLAAALGACGACWGGDENCEECDGGGEVGCYQPDRELYRELVAPAVRRVNANRAKHLRLAQSGR